jgi:hypothetical protein
VERELPEGTAIAESIEGQADGKETRLRRELASGFEIVLQETRPPPLFLVKRENGMSKMLQAAALHC